MTLLFIDTSYLIALEIVDDQSHKTAVTHWSSLMKTGSYSLLTHSYVFTETVTYLNNLRLHSKAVALGNDLLSSRRVDLIHVNEELFYEAWDYFQKHKDKTFSLTDCVSFVLMKRLSITHALTFDKHFAQAGFSKLP
jgi:predicted nucleic acid-binding protein